ncbi:acyl-n-protein [Diplodia corticola]|uniref:Acyl-n-protein n=1 Tax=Diplodia corticola TaxID=236234 RepID=A0A1J9R4R7_9PEZI|nr:acyl-n-protein [Diplodia corticola]OJD35226.1 acyl-n-protein [Diplodia corticola]
MLQTSITKWLSKPKAVSQPDAVPLEPQRPKKPDSNPEHPAKPITDTAADDGATITPTAPAAVLAHGSGSGSGSGSATASGSAPAHGSPPPPTTSIRTTTLAPLAPNITLAPLTSATLPSFRRLNTLLLEIPYPTKFYDEILTDPTTASITLAAFWRNTPTSTSTAPNQKTPSPGILIAGIRCRLLSPSASPLQTAPPTTTTTSTTQTQTQPPAPQHHLPKPQPHLYIATLSTLSPYRSHGLATHLLADVVATAARRHGVAAVCAHVWVANEDGLAWYRRRGFDVARREEGYYRRLRPSAAWVVWRRVGVGDWLVGGVGGVGAVAGKEDVEGAAGAAGAAEGEEGEEGKEEGEETEEEEGEGDGEGEGMGGVESAAGAGAGAGLIGKDGCKEIAG